MSASRISSSPWLWRLSFLLNRQLFFSVRWLFHRRTFAPRNSSSLTLHLCLEWTDWTLISLSFSFDQMWLRLINSLTIAIFLFLKTVWWEIDEVRWKIHSSSEVICFLPVDRTDTRNFVGITNAIGNQTFADFPSKHCRSLTLVIIDRVNHFAGRHFRLASADDTRTNGTSLMKSKHHQSVVSSCPWRKSANGFTCREFYSHIHEIRVTREMTFRNTLVPMKTETHLTTDIAWANALLR